MEKSWIVDNSVGIVGLGFFKECKSLFGVVEIMFDLSVVFVFVNSSYCVSCLVYRGVTTVVVFPSVESSLRKYGTLLVSSAYLSVVFVKLSELGVNKFVDVVLLVLLSVREIKFVKLGEACVRT